MTDSEVVDGKADTGEVPELLSVGGTRPRPSLIRLTMSSREYVEMAQTSSDERLATVNSADSV